MSTQGINLIYQLVQDDVKRADMQAKIWRRIHRSILNYHRMDTWRRDLLEDIYYFENPVTAVPNQGTTITGSNQLFMNWAGQIQSTINVQVLDLLQYPRFRKVNYLRKYQTITPYGTAIFDPTTGQQGTVQGGDLEERNPDTMFDGYGYDKTDCYYRSGNQIMISSSTPLDRVFCGFFMDPIVTLGCITQAEFETYDSWLADSYPDLIVADVKARVFNDIGKVEEANGITRNTATGMGDLPTQVLRLQTNEVRLGTR